MAGLRASVGALCAAALALLATAGCAAPTARVALPVPTTTQNPVPAPDVFRDGLVVSEAGEPDAWLSWSLTDEATGRRTGSPNAATERTNAESTIKAWIAVDHLRVAAARGRAVTPAQRDLLRRAVRSSDDDAAESLYRGLGGDAVLGHLRSVCGVDVDTERSGWWSFTQITAVDATRVLACVLRVAPGLPGGPELVADLRSVDEDGAVDLTGLPVPAVPVAQKNGWTYHGDSGWNVNCVLAWDRYTLAVLNRYSGRQSYGWDVCRDVTGDVLESLAA